MVAVTISSYCRLHLGVSLDLWKLLFFCSFLLTFFSTSYCLAASSWFLGGKPKVRAVGINKNYMVRARPSIESQWRGKVKMNGTNFVE